MDARIGVIHASVELDMSGMTKGLVATQKGIEGFERNTGRAMQASANLDRAVDKASQSMQRHTAKIQANTGQTANLVAQFNDIAVMMAAGQNPLQLAMQQGLQISQVLTQMGGGMGALRALGGAFIGMLNPISLITIGVIGFGAAAMQWLFPASEKAKETKDAFESLKDTMTNYNDALGVSLLYTGKAEEEYGTEAKRGAELARRIMLTEAKKTGDAINEIITKSYGDLGFEAFDEIHIAGKRKSESASLSEVADNLGFKITWGDALFGDGDHDSKHLAEVAKLGDAYRDLYATLAERPDADGLDQWLKTVSSQIDVLTGQIGQLKEAGADAAVIEQHTAKLDQLQQSLLVAEKQRADIRAADEPKAQEMLANYQQQAEMAALINQHGADSLVVRQAELEAEYSKQTAAIETLNITDEMKEQLIAAADANYEAESATLSWADAMSRVKGEIAGIVAILSQIGGGMISSAEKFTTAQLIREGKTRAEAEKIVRYAAEDRRVAAEKAGNVDRYGSVMGGVLNAGVDIAHAGNRNADEALASAIEFDTERSKAARGGGGRKGGGGGRKGRGGKSETERDMERQQKAADRLQDKLDELNATMGMSAEQERVWKAQRDAGVLGDKAGEAAIKQIVEQTIKLEEQKKVMEESQAAIDRMGDAFGDVFASIVTGSQSAKEAVANLLQTMASNIAKNAFSSFWAGLTGGGGGGFWAGLANLTFGSHANGGRVTSDLQLVGEAGPEIVSLAKSSKVYTNQETRALLGGSNDAGPSQHMVFSVDRGVIAQTLDQAKAQSMRISEAHTTSYDRTQAPRRMDQFNQNSRIRG